MSIFFFFFKPYILYFLAVWKEYWVAFYTLRAALTRRQPENICLKYKKTKMQIPVQINYRKELIFYTFLILKFLIKKYFTDLCYFWQEVQLIDSLMRKKYKQFLERLFKEKPWPKPVMVGLYVL